MPNLLTVYPGWGDNYEHKDAGSTKLFTEQRVKEVDMKTAIEKNTLEKRNKARIPFSGDIFFASKREFYEGRLKNYNQSGLFIETNASLSIGEIITVALPYVNEKRAKYQGQILWRNHKGFGVELFRKRDVWSRGSRIYRGN